MSNTLSKTLQLAAVRSRHRQDAPQPSQGSYTRHHRFDIEMLSERLIDATRFVGAHDATRGLPIGYFGASTGAAAALVAATSADETVGTIVSRGGRPDLAGAALPRVTAPTNR